MFSKARAARLAVLMGIGLAALLLTARASFAGSYDSVPDLRSGDALAIALDPNDPVPQIGYPYGCRTDCGHCGECRDERCGGCRRSRCHEDCHREHCHDHCHARCEDGCRTTRCEGCRPVRCEEGCRKVRCHDGCHARCSDWCGRQGCDGCRRGDCRHGRCEPRRPIPNTSLVDCSGRDPDAYRSVSEAARHTPPNGTIVIRPPGRGMTCVETLEAPGPVTIVSSGRTPAVIQAPPGQPCLIADIPLGDRLVVRNVKFIARGHDEPCVKVQAGTVAMQDVHIDSRNTDWAFDVGQSGELDLADSRIETDGSGVKASRADVELTNVEIDVEESSDDRQSAGLALDRTDGVVSGGRILGGKVGAWVSAGPHGLKIGGLQIDKTDRALVIHDGEQGSVRVADVRITNSLEGVLVSPGTEVRLHNISVDGARGTAVSLYGGRTELTSSHISRAGIGIALAPPSRWQPDFWERLFHCAHWRPEASEDYLLGKFAHVTGNEIVGVRYGFDLSDGGPAVIAGNSIVAHRDCWKGYGHHIDRHDNRCDD